MCVIFKESLLIKIKVYIKKLNFLAIWKMKLTQGKAERELYGGTLVIQLRSILK